MFFYISLSASFTSYSFKMFLLKRKFHFKKFFPIKIDPNWKMAADVIFLILMFIEHLCKNTSEVKKHLANEKQNELIIPERLFEEEQLPIKIKIKKYVTLKH